MNPAALLEHAQNALLLSIAVALPVLGVAAIVGLLVAAFQAASQIQDPTIAHLPRLLAVVAALVAKYTTFGRSLYAIGGNPEASRLSGLPVARNLIVTYTISGVLAGLAGLVAAAQLRQGSSLIGVGYELDAIAAVVVGGAVVVTSPPVSAPIPASPSAGVWTGALCAALVSAWVSVCPTPTRPAYQTSTRLSCGKDVDDAWPWM